jgi:hypothetical protein
MTKDRDEIVEDFNEDGIRPTDDMVEEAYQDRLREDRAAEYDDDDDDDDD